MSVATVHSMRGDAELPAWPRLHVDEAAWVLEWFGIPATGVRLSWHSPRPLSAAALVHVPSGEFLVKRHSRRVREVEQLEEEHRFSAHLLARGIGVTRVVQSPHGRSAVSDRDWTYEVHERGAGIDLYGAAVSWSPFTSRHHALAAGRALALMHAASRTYLAAPRSTDLLVSNDAVIRAAEPLQTIGRWAEARPALGDYLRLRRWRNDLSEVLMPFHDRYLALATSLEPLWTHNDWHASNLLWSDSSSMADVRTILDFGLCDRTTAIYDLATAIERNTIPWLDIHEGRPGRANLDLVDGLLQGYLSEARLSALEREALLAILPIVHVGYALTEIDYFHGITRSAEDADLAYGAFLLGHCRWFGHAEGRVLLAHIRERLLTLP